MNEVAAAIPAECPRVPAFEEIAQNSPQVGAAVGSESHSQYPPELLQAAEAAKTGASQIRQLFAHYSGWLPRPTARLFYCVVHQANTNRPRNHNRPRLQFCLDRLGSLVCSHPKSRISGTRREPVGRRECDWCNHHTASASFGDGASFDIRWWDYRRSNVSNRQAGCGQ